MVVIGIQVQCLSMMPPFQLSKMVYFNATGGYLESVPRCVKDIVSWARESGGLTPLGALRPSAIIEELACRLKETEGWERAELTPRAQEWRVELVCYRISHVKRR